MTASSDVSQSPLTCPDISGGETESSSGFRFSGSAKESHGKPIYCVAWSHDVHHCMSSETTSAADDADVLSEGEDSESTENSTSSFETQPCSRMRCVATCAVNHVTVYEVPEKRHSSRTDGFIFRQAYIDATESETFYACAFGGRSPQFETVDGPQLLCVAGRSGIIKVIDTVRRKLFMTLSGHGDEIYDMKFSPTNEWLLLSASKDQSLRLWNVKTAQAVAVFTGHEGHRDAVLSFGWHSLGQRFVSAGMDSSVKLWSIEEGTQVHAAIESSSVNRGKKSPWTPYSHMPYFSSNHVHSGYIDCVQFVGDLVLSKSISNRVILWKPNLVRRRNRRRKGPPRPRLPCEAIPLMEFPLSGCDVWFIRFQTDTLCGKLAIGNKAGHIELWDIDHLSQRKNPATTLIHKHCTSTVRLVSFSPDNECLVACCDDGTLWRWNAT